MLEGDADQPLGARNALLFRMGDPDKSKTVLALLLARNLASGKIEDPSSCSEVRCFRSSLVPDVEVSDGTRNMDLVSILEEGFFASSLGEKRISRQSWG